MKHRFSIIFIISLLLVFSNCNTTKTTPEEESIELLPPITSTIDKPHFETLTFDNFDLLMKQREGLQMAYFWATWCGPCRTIAPALDNISQDYAGRLTIGKLDVDAEKITADIHGVRSIPAFLFFKNGELVFQTSGLVTEQYLVDVIERLL